MCGIVGLAGNIDRDVLTRAVKAMNAAVAHRGPDDEGVWVGDHFAFAMRRLSIIDLAGGRQPMWEPRSHTGVVYNGEVYNYRVLRAALQKSGVRFKTASDTEVVLNSLVLKGPAAVHDWNGMFAVAAWDERQRKLLLIRDRLGVKPLYYYWDGAILMFASEIKALLASNLGSRCLNPQAVWDYLTYRYVPGPDTIWHNIWKLPPAHMMEWSAGSEPRISRYWKSDVASVDGDFHLERNAAEFDDLFLDAVDQCLLASDVPVGMMLSGGLDSSAIAAAAVELGHKQLHTFSVGFSEGGEHSELRYARMTAAHLGIQCHEVVTTRPAFMKMLEEVVAATDEPLADMTTVPLLAISRLAREHVKVVLSGEGADEILAGYNFETYSRQIAALARIQSFPPSVLKAVCTCIGLFSGRQAAKFFSAANIPLAQWNIAHKNHMTWYWREEEKAKLWPAFNGVNSDRILNAMYAAAGSPKPLDQLLSVYQQSWLVEDLLMKADKMSMAASLELRVPFLDYRLVEWANRQNIRAKIGSIGGRYITKRLLRRFAAKRLPREIIRRPKRGFPVPVYQWFKDKAFHAWSLDHLTGGGAKAKYFFVAKEMELELNQAAVNPLAAHKTWQLIVLETWLRQFDVDIPADPSSLPHLVSAI